MELTSTALERSHATLLELRRNGRVTSRSLTLQNFLAVFIRRRVFNDELKMTDSWKLLEDYVENGSETAFRELVSRYINLVYSTAVRLVDSDTHLAEDVVQTVFMDLARQARALSKDVMLGGWLHRHTCFVAAKAMRSNRRRQFRERQAVEMGESLRLCRWQWVRSMLTGPRQP